MLVKVVRRAVQSAGGGGGVLPYNGLTPDYYISTTGSNSNDGLTPETAWAFDAINAKRATYQGTAGNQKVLGIVDGTYSLITLYGQHTAADFGTGEYKIGQYTTLVAQTRADHNNPTAGVVGDWQRSLMTNTNEGAMFQPNGPGVIIDGLHIKGTNYRAITNYSGGASSFTVRNCLFTDQSFTESTGTGKNSCTIYTQDHNNILISNCRFEGGSAPADGDRHAIIQSYQATDGLTIEYCTFKGQSSPRTGNIIYFKQGQNKNLTVTNCYMEHTHGAGEFIYIAGDATDTAATYTYKKNVFNRASASATSGFIHVDTAQAGIVSISNNGFYGPIPSATGSLIYLWRGSPVLVSYFNNWLFRPGSPGSYGDLDFPEIAALGTVDHNLYDSSPTTIFKYNDQANSASGLAAWQGVSGKDANSIEASDPMLLGTGTDAEAFELDPASDGYNAGSDGKDIGPPIRYEQVGATV